MIGTLDSPHNYCHPLDTPFGITRGSTGYASKHVGQATEVSDSELKTPKVRSNAASVWPVPPAVPLVGCQERVDGWMSSTLSIRPWPQQFLSGFTY